MASNVSVFHEGWQKTGQTVPVDQWELELKVTWTDGEGVDQYWEGVVLFPNILADVPAPWLKEIFYDLTIRVARKKLGAYQDWEE